MTKKHWWFAGAGLAVLVALAVWWPLSTPEPSEVTPTHDDVAPRLDAPSSELSRPRALRGLVVRDETPVSGLVVSLYRAPPPATEQPVSCEFCRTALFDSDCPNATPLLEALVRARVGDGVPLATATTDAAGAFVFPDVVGAVALWVETPDELAWRDVETTSDRPLVLSLSSAGFVSGRVLGPDEQPKPGAVVTLISSTPRRFLEARTDAAGAFRLGPVRSFEALTLLARADGFFSAHVARPSVSSALTLRLGLPRVLAGRVTRLEAGVAGVSVELEGEHRRHRTVTDSTGAFRFEGLHAGRYVVRAQHGEDAAEVEQPLAPLDDALDVELELRPGMHVDGLVVDEASGAPLEGAQLTLFAPAARRVGVSGSEGRFDLGVVPQRRWQLLATREGYVRAELAATGPGLRVALRRASLLTGRVIEGDGVVVPDFRAVAHALLPDGGRVPTGASTWSRDGGFAFELAAGDYEVEVSAPDGHGVARGRAPGSVEVVLASLAKLTGSVFDADERPQPRVPVLVVGTGWSTSSDEAGRFELDLPAGTWTLTTLQEWELALQVTVREGERKDVVLRPTRGARLAGVFLDAQRRPIANALISGHHLDDERKRESTHTDARGRWALETLPAGAATLGAEAGGRMVVKTVSAPDSQVTLVLPAAPVVTGRVVDERGRALRRFRIDGRTFEASDGRFEVELEPTLDEATLAFQADGFARRDVEVKVTEGRKDLGAIALSRGRALTGVVLDAATRRPVPDVEVSAAPSEEPLLSPETVQTDAQGRFLLAAVDAATPFLHFSHPEYPPTSRRVGDEREVLLQRGALLTVRVRDEQGQSLAGAAVVLRDDDFNERSATERTPGVHVVAGLTPGRWRLMVEARGHVFRPRSVDFDGRDLTVDAQAASDGVTVNLSVPGAHWLFLRGDSDAVEVRGGVAQHVLPGRYQLNAHREGADGHDEVSDHELVVTSAAEQSYTFAPVWRRR
ncbi:MAG: carboxypeptidase regulatory-like domain-containing protein [Myxococcota bacterium]